MKVQGALKPNPKELNQTAGTVFPVVFSDWNSGGDHKIFQKLANYTWIGSSFNQEHEYHNDLA